MLSSTHVLPLSLAGPGGAPAPYELALATDAVTQLLASKDPADELLEEFFYNFPTIFTGLCFATFVVQYIQTAKPLESVAGIINDATEGLPIPYEFVVVPGIAIAFALAGKIGVLGAIGGLVAKTSMCASTARA